MRIGDKIVINVYYSNKSEYKDFFDKIETSQKISNENDIKPYKEKFATKQQKERDKIITDILKKYKENYENKADCNKKYKKKIADVCIVLIEASFAIFFLSIIVVLFCEDLRNSIQGVASLLTICVSMLGLIIGIFKIVTKYIFPEKEEKYITQIVNSIQTNDYNTKKAYMDYDKNTPFAKERNDML